ncbi:MAG: hypothetical protein FWG13_03965 [Leptospirales bacterium]|nr:hypothetical protein [Leptospirales bacterium]
MNSKSLVKLSNIIGIISIILLVYWVFIFIAITVFQLKIFRQNITEIFYMSVLGILALMLGALIINVMFNLTRIAEKHNNDGLNVSGVASKKLWLTFGLSFPIIFGLLLGGDFLTSKKKEKMLIASAKSIIESNPEKSAKLVNYHFDNRWIIETGDILAVFSKTDSYFPHVTVIANDTLDNAPVFLGFGQYYHSRIENKTQVEKVEKKDYIRATTKEEREYLQKVFQENYKEVRFSASHGKYELFYPYFKDGKKIVLYFSDRQQYGKIGS